MQSLVQRVMNEYKTLIVKMEKNMTLSIGHKANVVAIGNFGSLSNMEVLLSLAVFIPMLNVVHCFIKLTQARDIFIYDFL